MLIWDFNASSVPTTFKALSYSGRIWITEPAPVLTMPVETPD
jgi:hypothetical protein